MWKAWFSYHYFQNSQQFMTMTKDHVSKNHMTVCPKTTMVYNHNTMGLGYLVFDVHLFRLIFSWRWATIIKLLGACKWTQHRQVPRFFGSWWLSFFTTALWSLVATSWLLAIVFWSLPSTVLWSWLLSFAYVYIQNPQHEKICGLLLSKTQFVHKWAQCMRCMASGLLIMTMRSLATWSLAFTKLHTINMVLWMECVFEQYVWQVFNMSQTNRVYKLQTLSL